MSNKIFRKGDYVVVNYDGEDLTGKIISVQNDVALVEVCLSARRGEKILTDEISINVNQLNNLSIKKN